ncbi:hypothetical protein V6x_00490 [Gimesia chilikensis]|uniref:Uncharacterized protein n=1 Tax=Gimesia chilikensis TaxID=2605989 RepID=A0A517W549_9PLAN|nr:hypothetical protein [Gimesia chilikensis]QDU00376.1 hypothetical protein V6x_00490 [Gimesia chilikensis]
MSLQKKQDGYWYGDDHADLRQELQRYSELNGYPIDNFADVRCTCGNDSFYFGTDEDEGVALRICGRCEDEHLMGDSEEYAEEAEIEKHGCVCGAEVFQITAGIYRYRNEDDSLSPDVKWLYLGCRCVACGLVGCYADWKNEFNGYETLLAKM